MKKDCVSQSFLGITEVCNALYVATCREYVASILIFCFQYIWYWDMTIASKIMDAL